MPARPRVATALAALLVVVAVLAAALSGPLSLEARTGGVDATFSPPPVPTDSVTPPPAEDPLEAPPEPPAWASWLVRAVQAIVLLALLAGVALLLRRAARGWRLDRADDEDEHVEPGEDAGDELSATAFAALQDGVRAATRALEDDVPPGDAVIGAWVAVETAAARTGVVRERAQTASEFAVRVLDATRADPAATRELLALYLAARFGSQGVDEDDVRRARDLLAVVGEGLVAPADDAGVAR